MAARRARWWVFFAVSVAAAGCAQIVGLTGDYRERKAGGEAGDGSQGGVSAAGGAPSGGGEGGVGASATGGDAASAGVGMGGSNAAGAGGSGTSGASGASAGGGAGGVAGTGGGATTPPSCGEGLRTCGAEGDSDCCASLTVPGGTFARGNDAAYPARVHSFRLDVHEVTLARLRRFEAVLANGYHPNEGDGKNPNNSDDGGWQASFNEHLPVDGVAFRAELLCDRYATWTDDPGENDERPANCLDWYVAFAFCIWDGGRLPTEAEWNYAAAGGNDQRVYPWSDPSELEVIEERHASYWVDEGRECGGDHLDGCAVSDFIRPGSRPDGRGAFGHADLSGNVYEWVVDRYDPSATYPTPCNDCSNLTSGSSRTIRGGSFINYWALVRTHFRLDWDPDESAGGIGARCARAP